MPSALIIRKKAAAKKNSYKCLWRTFRKSAVKNKIRKEEQKKAKTCTLVDSSLLSDHTAQVAII